MTAKDVGEFIAIATGTLGLFGTARRVYSRWQVRRAAQATHRAELAATINRLVEHVDAIYRELQPNGGGTLRDTIMDIRNNLARERTARRLIAGAASFEVSIEPATGNVTVTHVSADYVRLTGLTRDDVEDNGWLRAVAPEDRDRVRQIAHQATEQDEVMTTQYNIVNVHTGKRTRVEHVGMPVFNYAGLVIGWVGVLREITA